MDSTAIGVQGGGTRLRIVLPRANAPAPQSVDIAVPIASVAASPPPIDDAPSVDDPSATVGAKKRTGGKHSTVASRAIAAKKLAEALEKIVIIQFGSRQMRVGTAADIAPQLVPSLVAYRIDQVNSSTSASVFASPVVSSASESDSTLKAREAAVSDLIRRRPAPAGNHSIQYALPDPLPQTRLNWTWTDLSSNPRVLCGQAALQLPDDAPYRVFAPFVRGNFNTDATVTPQHVMDAVVHLVRHAMNHVLGLPGLRFPNHSIAFVVGDNWSHVETSSIYQAMFTQLEFAAAFSHQESVLSCFGAGISSALVVDFGAEKTSVCCVDDGLTLPKSRAQLDVGGDDITEHLCWTLKRLDQSKGASGHSKSPFHLLPPELASLNVKRAQDFSVVDALKRDLCFVRDLSVMDPLPVYSYDICMCHRPDPSTRQYPPPSTHSFDVSGAVALAGAVLFQPSLLLTEPARSHQPRMSDFISIDQSDYLTAAQIEVVLSTRLNKKTEVKAKPVVGSMPVEVSRAGSPDSIEADQSVAVVFPSTFDVQTVSVALSSASEVMDSATAAHIRYLCGVSVDDERNPKRIRTIGPDIESRRHVSLIQAVCDVIAALPTVEMRDRFASNILLVGGGALLRGLTERFEELLNQAMPRHQALILRPPKVHAWVDIDPVHLAWKGAAVLVATDTNRDNWIELSEWSLRGPSALREKAMYLW